eukprot:832358-Amorphochlora_amoeboformis.AAC.2
MIIANVAQIRSVCRPDFFSKNNADNWEPPCSDTNQTGILRDLVGRPCFMLQLGTPAAAALRAACQQESWKKALGEAS